MKPQAVNLLSNRMKHLSVLITFLIAGLCNSQTEVINTGTSEVLTNIFVSGNNYLVSGNQTYLAKCSNGCNSLIKLNTPSFPNNSYRFTIERPDTGILYMTASSQQGLNLTLWKSNNGGYNWTKKFDTTSTNMYSGVTRFFDAQNGVSFCQNQGSLITNNGMNTYSFGTWSSTRPATAEIYGDSTIILAGCSVYCAWEISNDRGSTWPLNLQWGSGSYKPIDFEFISKDTIVCLTGMALWSSFISTTFNGGLTWKDIEITGNEYGTLPDDLLLHICAKKGNEIYFTARTKPVINGSYVGDGVILKTTDFGKTWLRYSTPFKENFYDMKFINDSIALVCGSNGLLFKWNSNRAVFTGIEENNSI
ncbi:MAG: hypothetical protein IT236_05800, partial [Bacteroidia bacterium]|nr:hypothetical protein [Bacteroidia bacterium]